MEFLQSSVATSIGIDRTASPGSLHEIEYLSHTGRDGDPVFLVGYCWGRGEFSDCDALQQLWAGIQVGGERSYGFGRVAGAQLTATAGTDGRLFEKYKIDLSSGVPKLMAQGEAPLFAHVAAPASLPQVKVGVVEPLVGRRVQQAESRFGLTQAIAAYAPGSLVSAGSQWEFGNEGLWAAADA